MAFFFSFFFFFVALARGRGVTSIFSLFHPCLFSLSLSLSLSLSICLSVDDGFGGAYKRYTGAPDTCITTVC